MTSFGQWLLDQYGLDISDGDLDQEFFAARLTEWIGEIVPDDAEVQTWLQGNLSEDALTLFELGSFTVLPSQADGDAAPVILFDNGETLALTAVEGGSTRSGPPQGVLQHLINIHEKNGTLDKVSDSGIGGSIEDLLEDDIALDIVFANYGSNTVYLNDGSGALTDSGQELGSAGSMDVALGDVNGDGFLDVVFANGGSNTVYLNDGSGAFTDSGQELGIDKSNGVALGDINGNGFLDIVFNNHSNGTVYLNDGSGNFTDSGQDLDIPGHRDGTGVALGDVNGDGFLDIVFANYGPGIVYLNDGNGTFTNSGQMLGDLEGDDYFFDVALGDINGDGFLDIAFASYGGSNAVYLNDGSGSFADSGQDLGTDLSTGIAIGDVNGDGHLDAVFANVRGSNTLYLNDGSGSFTASDQTLGDELSYGVALGDLGGDYLL